MYIADAARIWRCCGCGAGRQLQLRLDTPILETSICRRCSSTKTKKKKKRKEQFRVGASRGQSPWYWSLFFRLWVYLSWLLNLSYTFLLVSKHITEVGVKFDNPKFQATRDEQWGRLSRKEPEKNRSREQKDPHPPVPILAFSFQD